MFFKYCWKALVWSLFIFIISILPGREIPEVKIVGLDKVIHAAVYGTLAFLLAAGFMKQTSFPSLRCFACSWAFILCSAYGILLEVVQHNFVADRTGDWMDVAFNAAGAVVVSVSCAIHYRSL